MSFRYLTIFASALLLQGCEEPFFVDGVDLPSQIVVDSQLASGQRPQVILKALQAFGGVVEDERLSNSIVTLSIGENGRHYDLDYDEAASGESSVFTARDEVIIVGEQYRLRIEAPGFPAIRSQTLVPAKTAFDFGGARIDSNNAKSPGIDTFTGTFSLRYTMRDASPAASFYHVILTGGNDSDAAAYANLPFKFIRRLTGAHQIPGMGMIFSDESFRNELLENRVLVSRLVLEALNVTSVRLELRTVTKDYYEYYRRWALQGEAVLPAPTGDAELDNISGGRGVFASYTAQALEIEL